jgi:hypothetical protein
VCAGEMTLSHFSSLFECCKQIHLERSENKLLVRCWPLLCERKSQSCSAESPSRRPAEAYQNEKECSAKTILLSGVRECRKRTNCRSAVSVEKPHPEGDVASLQTG